MTAVLPGLDVDGPAAPPRSNGELVFAEPWEGRAFGLVLALVDGGVITYDRFRAALVARIAAQDSAPAPGQGDVYYRCWLAALEQVLDERALVTTGDVDAREAALSARPAGHDHREHEGHDSHH